VPISWTILDSAYGDLNKDGIKDAAIILQHKASVSVINGLQDTVLTQPKILIILFKNCFDSSFALIEQRSSFILKHDNSAMDDPYQEMAIKYKVLEIKFHLFYNMGSWYVKTLLINFAINNTSLF